MSCRAALSLSLLLAFANTPFLLAGGLTPKEKFFERSVRPLLIEHCHECHGDSLQESDLRLDSIDAVLQGGISGPAAIAGNLQDSLILRAVLGRGVESMPPEAPLESEQIAILRRWIKMGLPWPKMPEDLSNPNTGESIPLGDQEAIKKAAQSHWAFQPMQMPVVPELPDSMSPSKWNHWKTNPIDRFVASKLSEHDLSPSDQAPRATLIRRLYFDLIGLPPTIKQVQTFSADSRPTSQAIASVIDRLLDSEHHGERWARYWLDVARYADTRDWQAAADLRYPFAYTFRDYVIQSLNDDKPYDQFIREQIAADFYADHENSPELAALGFLSVGPQYRNNRLERSADRIDVVCRGLMGLTVSCARCHDHKYDPIPIQDYYSLYGVFSNTVPATQYPILPGHTVDPKTNQDYQRKIAAARKRFDDYQVKLRDDAVKSLSEMLPSYLLGFYEMSITKQNQVRGAISKFKVIETAMTPLNNRLARELKLKRFAKDPIFKPWQQSLTLTEAEFGKSIDQRMEDWSDDEKLHPLVREQLAKQKPRTRKQLVSAYGALFKTVIARWKAFSSENPNANRFADTHLESLRQKLMGEGGWLRLETTDVLQASRLLGTGRKQIEKFETAIADIEASHPGAPPRAMIVKDTDQITQPFVMLRGEAARRGDTVPKQFPRILAGENSKPFIDGSGRRELAEAIVSPTNPLTARMIVNRVWARYFGMGLVRSQDDFGLRSEPPSHPELLDFLALSLIENDWSLKWLHRTITTSQTYTQSSQVSERGAKKDPENRLLWRQNRRRLDFEAMRDAMLAVSNSLDRTIGGKSVRLSDTPYTRRRSVYAYVDRNEMDPILRTFDFASPTASTASRSQTTVPQQALFGMNHPWVADLSRAIATQFNLTNATPSQAVNRVHARILGRPATPEERKLLVSFMDGANEAPETSKSMWQYGVIQLGNKNDTTHGAITPLPYWNGTRYQGSDAFPDKLFGHAMVSKTGGHPGRTRAHAVVKRWTAPAAGTVRVNGILRHTRDNGDGILAVIHSGELRREFKARKNEVKTTTPPIEVKEGDFIDLIVAPGQSPLSDGFGWRVSVLGIGGGLKNQKWSSFEDFSPPPPPPLDPLAQVAQALLLTNEFLFVD